MEIRNSPHATRPDNMQAMRGSALGQMHQGELQTHIKHPFHRFLIKTNSVLNIISIGLLWALFAVDKLFPPHDAAFKWAIGAYFFFGLIYGVFSLFIFKFALFVENQAVVRAMTHNRSYEWHSQYDTQNITQEELKKLPQAQQRLTPNQAINAGKNFFNISKLLALSGIATFILGWYTFAQL